MRYRAKVLQADAQVRQVELEAADEAEARRVLAASGGRLLTLRPVRHGLPRLKGAAAFKLLVFNQQLHALLEAGQPIVDAIEILGRNDRTGRHRAVYDSLLQGLRHGKQLSEAMAALPSVFPALYLAMLRASETTGSVRAAIQRFMHYQRQVDAIRGQLLAAAVYPAILVGVGYLVVTFLLLYVVPRFSAVFEDVPRQTDMSRLVQAWGSLVNGYPWLAWGLCLALPLGGLLVALQPAVRAGVFRRVLRTPWLGDKVWTLQLARLYRTLGMLLRSGVSVLAAMRMSEAALPLAMQARLQQAGRAVSEGHPLSRVMAEQGLSTEVADRLLLAGESSGQLDEMLERIADFYDQEVAAWLDVAGRLIEPVLMVGIGLVIGAIVLMLYTPIFEMANAL
ncbi:type II secretion system F family protein [Chitinimonas arctica]|uniref:Type II secretion system F family protein n=1 Tax=Chitinimonas arctica TaxID=2594795 RepID=A0A516SA45_9NEIS|nr:type II secretion system F family protein [Chitinimonas arctica]QDQ25020.1 type II secretion system F family protein [Chitinimonas arctica]